MEDPLVKHMLCTECKKIYSINIQYRFILGISLIVISIFAMIVLQSYFSDNYIHQLIATGIAIIPFPLGMVTIYRTQDKVRDCHVCQGKQTLISVDTYEAIEFIKANNLSLPKPNEVEKKASWQA